MNPDMPKTRADVAKILASIGEPGEKRDEKLAAITKFNIKNLQGHSLELTLDSYQEF